MLPDSTKINDFTLIKILGTGTFSIVYLAKYNENGVLYALKKISKDKYGENVEREVKVMQRLKHPFIVSVEGFFETVNHFFIVTEYIDGMELFYFLKDIKKEKPYLLSRNNYQLTRSIASQIVLALEFMHNNDFVHLDIKPENILINRYGYVKIVDFGFARKLNTNIKNEYGTLYRTDKIKGTIEYLSPEMLRKYYGKCSDIWALGILILELSVNIPLFDRMGKQDILNTIKKCKIGKLVPNSLQTTIKDLLVNIFKFPPDRYPINKIKKHVFFKNIDWVNVLMRTEKLYDFEFPKTKDNSGIKEEYLFNQLE